MSMFTRSPRRAITTVAAVGALAAAAIVVPALAAPAFASDSSTAIALFTAINTSRQAQSVDAFKADGYLIDDAQRLAEKYAGSKHPCPTTDADAPKDSESAAPVANFVTCETITTGSDEANRLNEAYYANADHNDLVNNAVANYVGVGVYTHGTHVYSVLSIQVYNSAANQKISFGSPSITGEAKVGHTLDAVWKQAVLDDGFTPSSDANYYVDWYVGSQIVASGDTDYYIPQPADIGKKISVQVEVSATGHTPKITSSSKTAAVVEGTFKQTDETKPGKLQQLSANLYGDLGVITPAVTPTQLWSTGSGKFTSSDPIGEGFYAPTVANLGHKITFTATFAQAGYKTLTLTFSKTFEGFKYTYGGTTVLPAATITGWTTNPVVGETLSASNPDWGGTITTDVYTWKVNGVTKGTGTSIEVQPTWVGKTITVTYSASSALYPKTSVTSHATPKVVS